MSLWGVDLGGTKIEAVVLESPSVDKVIFRHRIDTEANNGYHHILDRIQLLIQHVSKTIGQIPTRLGIATPGSLDPLTGLLKNSNTVCLNNKPFLADLQTKLGISVRIANDANCFTLAESRMGVVREMAPLAKTVFGVIMGTGVGGGIVIDGKVVSGNHGNAGEWGHIYLDASGGKCYCGKIGCVERVISGTALQEYYAARNGTAKTLQEIVDLSETGGDKYAKETMDRLIHFFGLGISTVINVLDPDVIVLGGGLGNIERLYTDGVEQAAVHTFNPRLETPFLKPSLGDSAGVFGAALLVAEED